MKKKFMISMLVTLLLSLTVITTLFTIILSYNNIENLKSSIIRSNDMLSSMIASRGTNNTIDILKSFENEIRVTCVDNDGNIYYDSLNKKEDMNLIFDGDEIKALKNTEIGYNVLYLYKKRMNLLTYANKLSNGFILRTSIQTKTLIDFNIHHFNYYLIALILAIIMSVLFSGRLFYVIVKPIKDLEFVTSRIAKGEYYRRAKVTSKDEIGQLGLTFNNMANQLQNVIGDVLDKQNKLEAILKSMDSGVIAVDKNFNIIMMNPYAKTIFGIKKDIIGENLSKNIKNEKIEELFSGSDVYNKEIKITEPKERVLRIKTAEIINGYEKIGKVAVVNDITDIKKLENMRTQFVANVSHEIKTPLTSIKGFAETLRYVEDPINKEKFLNIINEESERLTRLIDDILCLSHIETSKNVIKEDFNINEVILEVYELIKNIADKKKIDIKISGQIISSLKGNRDRFKQMILNLLDNAVKYTDTNGRVEICSEEKSNEYVIVVKDNGYGIPKEDLDRVFERFYRVDKARSRAQGGTGLGLAIVKHIVLNFNGSIEIDSEIGEGSNFTIKIPK